MITALSGCATVSVYETTKIAEISLTSEQSQLSKATRSFHTTITDIGVDEDEHAFDKLISWFGGDGKSENAYWDSLEPNYRNIELIQAAVSEDVNRLVAKLADVNEAAGALLVSGVRGDDLSKADVTEVETVLISARNARDAFCDALEQANDKAETLVDVDLVLTALDAEIDQTAKIADEMAAARMSGALSSVHSLRG